jgi:hypothetical protein
MKKNSNSNINYFVLIAMALVMPIVISFSFIAKRVNLKPEIQCECDYRCMVKSLSDAESSKISWTPKTTNVKALSNLVQNFPIEDDKHKKGHHEIKIDKSLRFGFEFNVYEFSCKVKKIVKEESGDYVIHISDIKDSTVTIIGRVPNPECDYVKKSSFINSFKTVRADIDKMLNSEKGINNSTFVITGICFFNENSKAEICPVMDFVKAFRNY